MPNRYGFITHIALMLLITLLARPVSAQDTTSHFTLSAPELSREGYFVISLDQPPQPGMMLQQSSSPDFSTITAEFVWFGDFEKMTLTGFSNGDYYFRLAPSAEVASNSVTVKVLHYPAWQAYTLFFIGLVLFSLLVLTIIVLHRSRTKDPNRGADD